VRFFDRSMLHMEAVLAALERARQEFSIADQARDRGGGSRPRALSR
jgi:hypothetical protein